MRDTHSADLENALGHPTRREILRVLIYSERAKTVRELAELVPTVNISSLSYHLLVLEKEACVSRSGEPAPGDGRSPSYVATIAENQFVLDILNGTRGEPPTSPRCG
jgi:DNA-binding transcriptional ArsR family regulator